LLENIIKKVNICTRGGQKMEKYVQEGDQTKTLRKTKIENQLKK